MRARTLDPTVLGRWIGKSEQREDTIHLQTARLMQATLDREPVLETGELLPLCWHWPYFLEAKRRKLHNRLLEQGHRPILLAIRGSKSSSLTNSACGT